MQQAENVWLHLDLIKKLLEFSRGIFESVDYNYTTIPTYPGGQIGFLLCSNKPGVDFLKARHLADALAPNAQLQYYSEAIHTASFVLPAFAEAVLKLQAARHHHHAHAHAHGHAHEHK